MASEPAPFTDLLGRAVRDLRISVTDRCNFRCPYCMPAEVFGEKYHFLPKRELLSFKEIVKITELFVGMGVNKVRITGGEPLVRPGVHELIAMLAEIDGIGDITLTTNGFLLAENATELKNSGLHRVTVSLDSLDSEVFAKMNGRGYGPERVLEGIAAAESAGFDRLKINAVVERGVNDHTVLDLASHFKPTGHVVRFIEFMDVGNLNAWKRLRVVPSAELVEMINSVYPIHPLDPNYLGEVATRWGYDDGSGEIGFISSITQPFCGDCSRIRLSPQGQILTCLFANTGLDIKTPLRSGATNEELFALLSDLWGARVDRYSELRSSSANKRRKIEMYQIGG